jgi:hypothetical protein
MPKFRYLIYKGQELTMKEASKLSGISVRLISNRLSDGWEVEKILTTPKQAYVGWKHDVPVGYSIARQLRESFIGDPETAESVYC